MLASATIGESLTEVGNQEISQINFTKGKIFLYTKATVIFTMAGFIFSLSK